MGKGGEGPVDGEFHGDGTSGREVQDIGRRGLVAATVGLHPPLVEGEFVQRFDDCVGVVVVYRRVWTSLFVIVRTT